LTELFASRTSALLDLWRQSSYFLVLAGYQSSFNYCLDHEKTSFFVVQNDLLFPWATW